jgi:hypothetical protein
MRKPTVVEIRATLNAMLARLDNAVDGRLDPENWRVLRSQAAELERLLEKASTNHYRCTRLGVYGSGTPGYKDPRARQGYYMDAMSPEDAAAKVRHERGFKADDKLDVQLISGDSADDIIGTF